MLFALVWVFCVASVVDMSVVKDLVTLWKNFVGVSPHLLKMTGNHRSLFFLAVATLLLYQSRRRAGSMPMTRCLIFTVPVFYERTKPD
jgi:hypothetical protein